MQKIRVGVLGSGRQGSIHAKNLAYNIESAKLVAVADPIKANWANSNIEGIEFYEDCTRVLEDPDIDAVIIASSTDTHEEMILKACANRKHIFCEKPLALTMDAIDNCLKAVKESGVKFMLGFNRRFDPSFAKIRDMVREGKLGIPQVISIFSRDPAPPHFDYLKVSGGFFFDTTVHDFDMARYIMGDEMVEVYARGDALVFDDIRGLNDLDTTLVSVKFKSGAFGNISNSRINAYGFEQRVEVFGSSGALIGRNKQETQVEYRDINGVHTDKYLHFFTERYPEAFMYELKHFIEAIRDGKDVPVTGRDAKIAVLLSMAARESLQKNLPVKLDYSEYEFFD